MKCLSFSNTRVVYVQTTLRNRETTKTALKIGAGANEHDVDADDAVYYLSYASPLTLSNEAELAFRKSMKIMAVVSLNNSENLTSSAAQYELHWEMI